MSNECTVTGCKSQMHLKTYCKMHYVRNKRHGDPNIVLNVVPPRGGILQFFNESIQVETDDCIEWKYGRDTSGYGRFRYKNSIESVHRIALILKKGLAPVDKPFVLHSCDNPPCFNYRHLRYGNSVDNTQDKVNRNRHRKGITSPASKLTEQQVLEIRKAEGFNKDIGITYGIHGETVRMIKKGLIWQHL